MLQIRDLVWGLLFVGCTGKKLSCFLFIFGCVHDGFRGCGQSKVRGNEGRAVLAVEQHPPAALAGGIPAADSGQRRWVRACPADPAKTFWKK